MQRLNSVKWLVLIVIAFVFGECYKPVRKFEKYTPPPAPDYSLEKNWAALPTKKDSADALPDKSVQDNQANAKADVFFIHPTLYFKAKSWNADLNDKNANLLTEKYAIRQQASVFNGSCKVYAPRYRQATLASFTETKGNGPKALEIAYADVKEAFQYYLKHYNNGRPIVIAGHSQGAFLAARLLKDFFDNDPQLRKQLVAAYLIGGTASKNMFVNIPAGDSASQTGCYIAWHCRKWDTYFLKMNKTRAKMVGYDNSENYECVNPLTWTHDTAYVPASKNLGSVPRNFDRIDKGIIDAKISPQLIIWSHAPKTAGYLKGDNLHAMDYSLYWMNLRENVGVRVEGFLKGK